MAKRQANNSAEGVKTDILAWWDEGSVVKEIAEVLDLDIEFVRETVGRDRRIKRGFEHHRDRFHQFRELEIERMLLAGSSVKTIARRVGLSTATIYSRRKQLQLMGVVSS